MDRAMRTLRRACVGVTVVTVLLVGHPGPAVTQTLYATPEAGWSEFRGITLGARIGAELMGGLDVVGQGLVSFPDEDGVADPGVSVDRSAWQVSANLLYVFDRSRAVAPYVGVGIRYAQTRLSVVVDGLRASRGRGGTDANLLGGLLFKELPGLSFLEFRGGRGPWLFTGGGRWAIGG